MLNLSILYTEFGFLFVFIKVVEFPTFNIDK